MRFLLRSTTFAVLLSLVAGGVVGMPSAAVAAPGDGVSDVSVPMSARAKVVPKAHAAPPVQRPQVAWPTAGSATVDLPSASTRGVQSAASAVVGGLPIAVSAATGSAVADVLTSRGPVADPSAAPASVSRVALSVLDRATAQRLGVGVILTAGRADGQTGSAPVSFDIDYAKFAFGYGADYGRRLRLVQLPSCALTTPDRRECADQQPVTNGRNNMVTSKVSGTVDLAVPATPPVMASAEGGQGGGAAGPEPMVLAITSSSSSDSGDFTASTLSQSSSWAAGSNSGDFTTSVPLTVPPAPGGLVPSVALNYSSGSVDGLTKSTNTQAPWTGEGWTLSGVSFVERPYRSCKDDGVAYTGGDLCWVSSLPVSIVLNGQSTQIMDNSGNGLKAEDDSLGWKVERLTGAGNGARDGEYFKVTTMDGTQYFFGYRDRAAYGGVQRVEVFGNNSGEPCYVGTNFNANHCPQAYRWNLDYVLDRFGNTMVYNWGVYEGNYGMNRNTTAVTYDITSTLASIEYGANINVSGSTPTGKVTFAQGFRCFYGDCAHTTDPSVWMDTPWDQRCETWATSCPGLYAPTFWTLYKLDEIKSSVWDAGIGGWTTVDWIAPSYGFPSTGDFISPAGDDTSPSLWAWRIWLHNRPPIDISGIRLANRVFWGNDLNRAPMNHYRIEWLKSGTGQTTTVTYSGQECTRTNVYDGASDHNPRRCFPQYEDDQYRWYHKYVATDVTVTDTVGGSPTQRWHYDYSTAAARPVGDEWSAALWHYDSNWMVPANRRAFSQWRGYTNVTTTHGNADGTGPQQVTENIYYRGMHGDRTTAGGFGTRNAKFSDGWDHDIVDHEAMQGKLRRSMVFDGRTGVWTSAVRHHPTITQTGGQYMGGGTPDLKAWRALETTTITQTAMAGPTYRLTQTDTTYDSTYPIPTLVRDHGDLDAAIGTSDDQCTATSYVTPDQTKYLVNFPKQTLTTTCAPTPAAADHLAGTQYFYDGSSTLGSLGAGANAKGNVTKTLGLKQATAVPLPASDWIQQTRATYDVRGRTLDIFDGLDRKTTTVYTPATGGPTTSHAVTIPPPGGTGAGFTTTTNVDIRWGAPVTITDPNGKITRAEYDPSGRLVKVWKNHRAATGTGGVTPDNEYAYVLRDNGPNYVSTKTLVHTGAQIESFAVLDGLLRPRRAETVAATGTGRMIVDTFYDTVGNIDKKLTFFNTLTANPNLDWYSEPGVPSRQQFVYDNLGRVLRDQLLAGNGTTIRESIYTYDGDKTTTMQPPAGGSATTTISDVRGTPVELRQHVGGTPAGAVDVTTKYTYDRLGQLTKVADNANNQWLYEYDLLGRSTITTDPDVGISTSTYDNAGQLIETVDGNNTKLVHKYDGLGRKTELRETSATGFVRASWTYDPVGAKGQIASTSRHEDASTTYTSTVNEYDDAYRVKQTTYSIPGFASGGTGTLSYTVKNSYTVDGLLATQELPAANGLNAEILTHNYSPVGKATTMVNNSGQTYVNNTEYQFDGLIQRQYFGNAGKQVRLTNDFDAATRRLSKMWTSVESQTQPGSFQVPYDNTYSYDKAGNVTAIAGRVHGVADQQECFSYDHLRRMTEAWTQTSGACTTPQRTGVDPYRRQWPAAGGYDKLGSRLKQIDKDTTDSTWNYTIGGVDSCGGASKPHAVTSITATGPKAGTPTRTFCYDAAGNTTTRTTDTGVAQNLTWDKEGHLRSVSQGANTWTNIYDVDGTRLIAKAPTGDTLYLPDGTEIKKLTSGQLEATRYYSHNGKTIAVRNGTTLTWISADHHGTQQVQIAATNLSYQRRRSLPFGEPRGTQPTFIGTKGYVGGTIDDTGLTHIGAREYDPTLGRFVSIDPEIDHFDPQTLHGYLYSNNNPTTFTDPTGRSWASIGKGLKDGWFKVNTAPIQFMDNIVKTQLGHVDAVVSGNESVGEAFNNYGDFAADVAVDVALSPVTTAAEMFTEGENAIDAARDGDWEGAAEHGYVAAADAAYTVAFVWGVGSRFGRCHSFEPTTLVLMAEGTAKPIAEVAVGDQVLATDPVTGVTEAKPVTDLHINEDWDLADVTILNQQTGEVGTIETTWTHSFWNVTDQQWTEAAQLIPGDRLRDLDGTRELVVTDIELRVGSAHMFDLTVADIHTYYVLAGETSVLVHNCKRGGLDFTEAEKQTVYNENLAANNGILLCHYCKRQVFRRPSQSGVAGRPDDAQIDHVDPKSKGGHGGAHNGVVACRVCNRDKSANTVQQWDDRLRGFLE